MKWWVWPVYTIVAFGLFFGLLFGLNNPEIQDILAHQATICTVVTNSVWRKYDCYHDCTQCSTVPSETISCGALEAQYEALDVEKCFNGTGCPVQGASCNNGNKCCTTVCSTCVSCSSINGKLSCHNYSCDCYCAHSISNHQCFVRCDTLYTVVTVLKYENQTAIYTREFGKDEAAKNEYLESKPPNRSVLCFYDPNHPEVVKLSNDYTGWKWAIFTIFGLIPMLIWLVGSLYYLCMFRRTTTTTTTLPPPQSPPIDKEVVLL